MRAKNLLLIVLMLTPSIATAEELFGVGESSATTKPTTRESREQRTVRKNPPNVVDILEPVDSPDGFSAGTMTNVAVVADDVAPRIQLGYREKNFPREGIWTGPEVETDIEFRDLIASFNAYAPDDTGVTLEIRVKQGETWSPWLFMQSWGRVVFPPNRTIKFDGGLVDIDTIELKKPASAYQCRIGLIAFNYDTKVAPSIRRLSVCYSGVVDDAKEREELAKKPTTLPSNFARDLPVPFRGQGAFNNPRSLWGLICSPTSTSMVLEYYGASFNTVENCDRIYDPQYDMFGNWGRAVARAGEVGMDAWLARFRSWDQVKEQIAQGTPVIASIRFRKGEVDGFLYKATAGHLLVVRGFDGKGGVIVNDPARRETGGGAVYPEKEFAKAWFDNGGVGYVIKRPAKPIPPTLVRGGVTPLDRSPSAAATNPTTAPIAVR
jgi:hypothetical protein